MLHISLLLHWMQTGAQHFGVGVIERWIFGLLLKNRKVVGLVH